MKKLANILDLQSWDQNTHTSIEDFLVARNWETGNIDELSEYIEVLYRKIPDKPFKESEVDRSETRAAVAVACLLQDEPAENPHRQGLLGFAFWAKTLKQAIVLLRRLQITDELIEATLRSAIQEAFRENPRLLMRAQVSLGKAFSIMGISKDNGVTHEEYVLFLVKTAVILQRMNLKEDDPKKLLIKRAKEYLGVLNPEDFFNWDELGEEGFADLDGGIQ